MLDPEILGTEVEASQRRWNHEKLLTVFTGLLVLVGLAYSITSIFQWLSMRDQARAMGQQMEVMRAEIEAARLTRSVDFMLRFDDLLEKQPNPRLRLSIQSGKAILRVHGGKFSKDDLEGYLGIFDNLNDLYQKGMINKDLFYNDYSYDVIKLNDNAEVQSYLKDIRKDEASAGSYAGVEILAKQMKAYPKPQ